MKKAQTIGQVLMFVLAGLVFVLILVYGYRATSGLLERGEQVELLDFKNRLESSVETIKRDYGSVQRVDLRVPKADQLCFVTDPKHENENPVSHEQLQSQKPLVYNAWRTGTENVFLIPKQETPIFIKDLVADCPGGYCCIDAKARKISLYVEGTGKTAKVKEWK